MDEKMKIDVSENGEILVLTIGAKAWCVFPRVASLAVAHLVIAGQTRAPDVKLEPCNETEVPRG